MASRFVLGLTAAAVPAADALLLPLADAAPVEGLRRVYCLAGCRHVLTTRASVARGYGPECWAQLHGTAPVPAGFEVAQDGLF